MTDNATQSAFIQSLFRIDPTQGFVEYVQATKPYHTKILDVLVEYVYAENVNVTISDRISWVMEFTRPNFDVVYSCGYGFVWDPLLTITTPDAPLAPLTILEATAAIEAPLPGYQNSNTFLIQPAVFVPFVTAAASTGNNQLVLSKNYDISGVDLVNNTWEISDPLNTLVAELTTIPTPKVFFISSDTGLSGNGRYTVLGTPTQPLVDSANNITNPDRFTISGNYTANFTTGTIFEIVGSVGNNGTYTTVANATFAAGFTTIYVTDGSITVNELSGFGTGTIGTTFVKVVETISVQANGDGVFHRVLEGAELPVWPAGQAVTFPIPVGTLPGPLITGTRYFFQPLPTPGYFNLSYTRYPTTFAHFVDLTSLGSGEFTMERDESLIPGASITISGTHFGRNNGHYIVKDIVPESSYQTIAVAPPTLGAFVTALAADTYDFDVTIDGGPLQQLSIVTLGGETYTAVAALMDAVVVGGSVTYNDVRSMFVVASDTIGITAAVVVAAGTAGSFGGDLFTALAAADTVTFTIDNDERVFVYQKIQDSTPLLFLGGDGQIILDINGFDAPIYCPPTQMPDFYTAAFIHESLRFQFEINLSDSMDASYSENAARGFGETEYGDAMLGSYGTYADSFDTRTAQTSGSPGPDSAHTILPTGIDTQLFDVGGFDETLQTVRHLYGRDVPLP